MTTKLKFRGTNASIKNWILFRKIFFYLDVKIVDLLFRLHGIDVEWQTRDLVRAVGHQEDSELELGNTFT